MVMIPAGVFVLWKVRPKLAALAAAATADDATEDTDTDTASAVGSADTDADADADTDTDTASETEVPVSEADPAADDDAATVPTPRAGPREVRSTWTRTAARARGGRWPRASRR